MIKGCSQHPEKNTSGFFQFEIFYLQFENYNVKASFRMSSVKFNTNSNFTVKHRKILQNLLTLQFIYLAGRITAEFKLL